MLLGRLTHLGSNRFIDPALPFLESRVFHCVRSTVLVSCPAVPCRSGEAAAGKALLFPDAGRLE